MFSFLIFLCFSPSLSSKTSFIVSREQKSNTVSNDKGSNLNKQNNPILNISTKGGDSPDYSPDNDDDDDNSDQLSPLPSGDGHLITPSPGIVIKVLRSTGEKIFINLCEHEEIPQSNIGINYNKWPFIVLTPARFTIDEKSEGVGINVYDAIVHPNVVTLLNKDYNAKDHVSFYYLCLHK